MPGLAFPPVGRLGLTSPPSPVLCSAKTALCPSRVASLVARGPIPCLLPRVCVPYGSSWRGSTSITPGLLVSRYPSSSGDSDKETSGSLQFPSSPCEYMPRSQTPVVSRTPGSLSAGLLPSTRARVSAFSPASTGIILWTTTILISELYDAACRLATPGSVQPLTKLHAGSLLSGWLGVAQVGLESSNSHPLGNTDLFPEVPSIP